MYPLPAVDQHQGGQPVHERPGAGTSHEGAVGEHRLAADDRNLGVHLLHGYGLDVEAGRSQVAGQDPALVILARHHDLGEGWATIDQGAGDKGTVGDGGHVEAVQGAHRGAGDADGARRRPA